MCQMLEGGENPLYIARRLIRFASEDIGMADSHALPLAVSVYQACHFLGMPAMVETYAILSLLISILAVTNIQL